MKYELKQFCIGLLIVIGVLAVFSPMWRAVDKAAHEYSEGLPP